MSSATPSTSRRCSCGKLSPKLVRGLCRAIRDDVEHPALLEVRQNRNITLAAAEVLLVHPDVLEILETPAGEPPLDGEPLDPVRLVPGDAQDLLGLADRASPQEHVDREALEEQRELRARAGPGDHDRLGPVLGAVRARDPATDPRLKLHRIEMPPAPKPPVIPRIGHLRPQPWPRASHLALFAEPPRS